MKKLNDLKSKRKNRPKINHEHDMRKTHITIYDVGEHSTLKTKNESLKKSNPMNPPLDYDFEYCISCDLRLLNGEQIITKGILDEFEAFASSVKKNASNYVNREEITMQHLDVEALKRNIKKALEFARSSCS